MTGREKIAKELLRVEALKLSVEKPFTFVSGIKSPIYCDNRKVIGDPQGRDIIVQEFLEVLKNEEFDIIAGTSTAGIPWAAFLADRLGVPMAYIRSKPKAHGGGRQIEGGEVQGKKVIIIEDLISTGGSCITALDAARNEGAKEAKILAIFSYGFPVAKTKFEEANCQWESLSDFHTLLEVAGKEEILSEDKIEIAKRWNKAPKEWNGR